MLKEIEETMGGELDNNRYIYVRLSGQAAFSEAVTQFSPYEHLLLFQ